MADPFVENVLAGWGRDRKMKIREIEETDNPDVVKVTADVYGPTLNLLTGKPGEDAVIYTLVLPSCSSCGNLRLLQSEKKHECAENAR